MLRLPKFRYHTPETLEEALSLLLRFKRGASLVAGGTDLFPRLKRREISAKHVISIRRIETLRRIERIDGHLRIGPAVTHDVLGRVQTLPSPAFDGLQKACGSLASPQIRVMGTLGGNICNASPSADSLPSLLALEAKVELKGVEGPRSTDLLDFLKGPFQTGLGPGEIVTGIRIPLPEVECVSTYVKLPKATEKDETLAGIAVFLEVDRSTGTLGKVRIGMGSVGPTSLRARRAEAVVEGNRIRKELFEKAGEIASEEACPRSRAEYRKEMIRYLVPMAFHNALEKIRIKL